MVSREIRRNRGIAGNPVSGLHKKAPPADLPAGRLWAASLEEVRIMVLLETLDDLDFLKGIDPDHLRHLIALGELREYAPGTVLFREGQECWWVYLVLSGE